MVEETKQIEDKELSSEDKEMIFKYLSESGAAPSQEEKHNAHTFLNKIATEVDTLKVSYLQDDELGKSLHPVRALQEFSLISEVIIENEVFSKFFKSQSEIITASALSRDGFLAKLAITQARQIADITKKPKKENKGWFGSKKDKKEDETKIE